MHHYADIALPTAVRRQFTYAIPQHLLGKVEPGMRVWVPLRGRFAIGMTVNIHSEQPDFELQPIAKLLDEKPILSAELLGITDWVHRFYFASWGETIQAALPAGLNFVAETMIRVVNNAVADLPGLEGEIGTEVFQQERYSLSEALRRWGKDGKKAIDKLVDRGYLECWEEPKLKSEGKKRIQWAWADLIAKETALELSAAYEGKKKPKWVKALDVLREIELPALQDDLASVAEITPYTLKKIEFEGLIVKSKVLGMAPPDLEHNPGNLKLLNYRQELAFNDIATAIDSGEYKNFLLHGVTGSGKTEVYIHALQKALESGKGGLVLVPEIALTPQTVKRFYMIFGNKIAVLHSRLSQGERFTAWRELAEGSKTIAIGARSAVFAPVPNLGLIIVDEEHDSSYKQDDPAPRYNAREVALMRAWQTKAVVVLGSATPSMVSLHLTHNGKAQKLELPGRHTGSELPEIRIIDLKKYRSAMKGPLAVPLYLAIQSALDRGEQIILLLNRRGFASFVQCSDCGTVVECPTCSVSLTYHRPLNHLRCHYCGYSSRMISQCPSCHKHALELQGQGTQRVFEDLGDIFPEAKLLRMDQDTTSGKDGHAKILKTFGDGDADILVGTQLVSKGLDFPNVTVVGVINADTENAFPSYRSNERIFQLLSQVSGRAGRAQKKGQVFIQTRKPEQMAVRYAAIHDFEHFAHEEMNYREMLAYPPFSRVIRATFKSQDGNRVKEVADIFSGCLREASGNGAILGPAPAAIHRVKREFRWECMLKVSPSNGASAIERMLKKAFDIYQEKKPKGASSVRINIDVDAL